MTIQERNEAQLISEGFTEEKGEWTLGNIRCQFVGNFLAFGIKGEHGLEVYGTVDRENAKVEDVMDAYCIKQGLLSFEDACRRIRDNIIERRTKLESYTVDLIAYAASCELHLIAENAGLFEKSFVFVVPARKGVWVELFKIAVRHDNGIEFIFEETSYLVDGESAKFNVQLLVQEWDYGAEVEAPGRVSYGTTQRFRNLHEAFPYLFRYSPVQVEKESAVVYTALSVPTGGLLGAYFEREELRTITAYEIQFKESVPSRD